MPNNKFSQISLLDIYEDVNTSFTEKKSELVSLLEKHIDFSSLISYEFHHAFYSNIGRKHKYHLESFIKALIIQKLFAFNKADYLIFDTTGIEPYVAENNPKFLNTKLKEAKKLSKTHPEYNPYMGVYSMLPDISKANAEVKQQYINGHYCYAHKMGVMTNGIDFDEYRTPLCPLDKTPFSFPGKSGGKNRSQRFKWVCHKSVQDGSTHICTCQTPCTESPYGKCTYTYPDRDFRMYPGVPRNTEHWDNLYNHRVYIERTIFLLKDCFGLNTLRTQNTTTIKADVYLAAITQLIGVILAKSIHELKLFKSIRKLVKQAA